MAVNHSEITTYGHSVLKLELDLRREFKWLFIIADIADFLINYNLLIDLKNKRLLDGTIKISSIFKYIPRIC